MSKDFFNLPERQVIHKIKLLKQIQPREEWKVSNRAFLLAKIENEFCVEARQCLVTKKQKRSISSLIRDIRLPLHNFQAEEIPDFQFQDSQKSFIGRMRAVLFLRTLVRPIFVVILFFSITCGTFAAVGVKSQESIPGDRLYPIKIAIENAETFLTSQDKKAGLHTDLAEMFLTPLTQQILKAL